MFQRSNLSGARKTTRTTTTGGIVALGFAAFWRIAVFE
jgi:hypothetical protein